MLSRKMQSALNDQINAEFGSAYLYLSMSAWCESHDLPGFAAWFRNQSKEEVGHAMKIFDFVVDRDGEVTLQEVAAPASKFRNLEVVWETTLKAEQGVTERINKLYALAGAEKDYASQAMLQWFLTEQIEEEKTASMMLEQVRKVGPSSSALFFLDRHAGKVAEEKE